MLIRYNLFSTIHKFCWALANCKHTLFHYHSITYDQFSNYSHATKRKLCKAQVSAQLKEVCSKEANLNSNFLNTVNKLPTATSRLTAISMVRPRQVLFHLPLYLILQTFWAKHIEIFHGPQISSVDQGLPWCSWHPCEWPHHGFGSGGKSQPLPGFHILPAKL